MALACFTAPLALFLPSTEHINNNSVHTDRTQVSTIVHFLNSIMGRGGRERETGGDKPPTSLPYIFLPSLSVLMWTMFLLRPEYSSHCGPLFKFILKVEQWLTIIFSRANHMNGPSSLMSMNIFIYAYHKSFIMFKMLMPFVPEGNVFK